MSKQEVRDRIKTAYEETVELNELKYDGSLTDIDYFGLFFKAGTHDKLFKFLGVNVCMFNCIYNNDDAVLIIFSIPMNTDSSTKKIADRVMEVTEEMEKCFITVDHIHSREVKDDKFVYVTVIKQVKRS